MKDIEITLQQQNSQLSDPEFEEIDEKITDSEDDDVLHDDKNIYTLKNPTKSTLEYMENI